ncbi:MAG TPA: UbiA family prenyltransferase [Bryobacteraceae bacterium]|jgi:4-hydroxybenzoate polyprenyltransferase|nr:UbiA family prenyltransferase [Bryobacteraceae bacterium]
MYPVAKLPPSEPPAATSLLPLCVDLDGTLIRTDLLLESLLLLVRQNFWYLFWVPFWMFAGKAALKQRLAEKVCLDAAAIPYNKDLVEWVREQKRQGRRTVLATASNRILAAKVSAYLGCFDEVLSSDEIVNLSGDTKRAALVARFGDRGFDYAGNSRKDLSIWARCNDCIVVHAAKPTLARAQKIGSVSQIFQKPRTRLKTWLRALRVHQWIKNILVCVPLFTAHRFSDLVAIKNVAILFCAFSTCASVIYIVNDLLDLPADRAHATKSSRPFASGELSIIQGCILGLIFSLISIALAYDLPPSAQFVLACYFVLTSLYSVWLKRKLILDVLVLASLYTIRIFAGGAAAHIKISGWLITFSLFFFLSLAMCKRSSELMNLMKSNKTRTSGRFYETSDLEPLNICGISSGMLACLIILLYESSQQAQLLYATPQLLFLLCPLLFYWISRLWVLTFRGVLQEDPILFAVRDRVSYAVSVAMAMIVGLAASVRIPLDRFLQ